MATQGNPVHVQAGLPIDEVTRPELIETGRANLSNRNVRTYETQALEKRLGLKPQTVSRIGGTSRASGARLLTHNERPCVIDASASIDQYVPTLDKWSTAPNLPEAVYALQPLPSPTSDATVLDSATVDGMIAIAYARADDSAAVMAVVDAETGGIISPLSILGSGSYDRGIHAVGAIKGRYFIAVTTSDVDNEVRAYFFDTSNVANGWISLGTIETDLATGYTSVCELDDRLIVAYGVSSGSNRVVVKALDETGVVDSNALLATTTPVIVDVAGSSSDVVWVIWDNSTAPNVRAAALSPLALSTFVGTAANVDTIISADIISLRVCAGGTHNAQFWVAQHNVGASTAHVMCMTIVAGAVVRGKDGVATGSQFGSYAGVIISSRPFYRDGRYYMFIAAGAGDAEDDANYQGTCVLVDWTLTSPHSTTRFLRPVANVEPGLAPRLQIWSKVYPLPLDSTRWFYARQFITQGSESDGSASYGSALVELDFVSRDRWRSTDHHGVTPIGGGVVGVWDGADFTELGYLARPNPPEVTTSTGSLTGTFRYVVIYEDVDAAGNVVVSGVSNPTDMVTLTGQEANINPQQFAVTYRTRVIGTTAGLSQSRVRNILYRTLNGGEPPYYRLGPNTTAVVDDTSDAELATHPKLYAPNLPGAVGEALDRRAPPQLTHIVSYNGMLVGAKGSSLFWSGQEVYGEATWFNPAFELPVSAGGDFTGLAVQDGYIVGFKRDRVFVVTGEIPSDNGAQGGLGTPRLVASEWGCVNADSIVATQLGVFFQSERGIEVFTRAQSVEWVGEAIVDTLGSYPVVTSAVVDARNSIVRFTLAEEMTSGVATGTGVAAVFDLSMKAWVSIDDMSAPAQSAAYVSLDGSRYAWLSADGIVHTERDRGENWECRDDQAWVTSQYTPASWRLGLQQDQRIFEMVPLFQRNSSCGITIEVAEDYGAFGAITPDAVWTQAFLDARPTATQVCLRTRGHGFAAQLRLRDTEPTDLSEALDTGRGITWIGISADIGAKQGATRGTPALADEMRR